MQLHVDASEWFWGDPDAWINRLDRSFLIYSRTIHQVDIFGKRWRENSKKLSEYATTTCVRRTQAKAEESVCVCVCVNILHSN